MTDGACNNAEDLAIFNDPNTDLEAVVGGCARENLGMEPDTRDCIAERSNLSDACVDCFDQTVQCTFEHCITDCVAGASSPGCASCQAEHCNPAFIMCSGLDNE
jgi:hypothetical protein